MAAALVLVPALPAVKAALLADASLTTLLVGRVYLDVPQASAGLAYPFVSLEDAGEEALDTIGSEESDLNCGGIAHIDARVVSRYRGPEQGLDIASRMRAVLHRKQLTLAGFNTATVVCEDLVFVGLVDVAGVKTREWVLPISVTAHQS